MSTGWIIFWLYFIVGLYPCRLTFRALMKSERDPDWDDLVVSGVGALCVYLIWPLSVPFFLAHARWKDPRKAAARLGGESREDKVKRLEREKIERDQHINRLERELGIGRDDENFHRDDLLASRFKA